jgi:hypothetical protein
VPILALYHQLEKILASNVCRIDIVRELLFVPLFVGLEVSVFVRGDAATAREILLDIIFERQPCAEKQLFSRLCHWPDTPFR